MYANNVHITPVSRICYAIISGRAGGQHFGRAAAGDRAVTAPSSWRLGPPSWVAAGTADPLDNQHYQPCLRWQAGVRDSEYRLTATLWMSVPYSKGR